MATITMYLKHQDDDLYYSMDNRKFKPLEEDTVTGVNAGDTVNWELAKDSGIRAIKKIAINESKNGHKAADIWSTDPQPANRENTIFTGTVDKNLDDSPKFNGYTIYYKTVDGEKHKDPEIQQPPPSGDDGDGD